MNTDTYRFYELRASSVLGDRVVGEAKRRELRLSRIVLAIIDARSSTLNDFGLPENNCENCAGEVKLDWA